MIQSFKYEHRDTELASELESRSAGTSFWDHLVELRSRVKVVLIMLLGTTVFFLLFPANLSDFLNPRTFLNGMYTPEVTVLLNWIKNYVAPQGMQIISLEIGAPIEVYFIASLVLALIVSSPVIAYEIFKFVDPALYPNERKSLYPFVAGFTILFLGGAAFGLLILSPFITYTVVIFSQFVGAQPVISVMDFYAMTLTTVAFTGVGFTIPEIFLLLVKFGMIKRSSFTKNRKYIYPALFVATAIITPDGGPLADLALFVPLLLLMEGAVQIARRYEKPADRAEAYPKCRFCNHKMKESDAFCPRCHKSQA